MEYERDLLKNNNKSIVRLILGIAFIVISVLWITVRDADNELIRSFDWFYSGFFTLTGVAHILLGLGISIQKFFGKAFIRIDNDLIDVKLGLFEKEQKIFWHDIQSIEYKSFNFKIQKQNNTSIISISNLDYPSISEIKNIMTKLADKKEIKCNIQ